MFDTYIEKPWRIKGGTFLSFDYMHLLKNIRNDWITEKTQVLSFELACEQITAKWSDITKFHQLELNNFVKMSKLPEAAARPKPM